MDQPETLLASLSDEGKALVPVNLRLMAAPEPAEDTDERLVESARHRARGYHCYAFHKPISRCLPINRP